MSRSRSDLVLEILDALGVLPSGQTAQAEDVQRIDEVLPSLMATFAGTEIVYIADLEAIPDADFRPLAEMCAYECREKFGVTGDEAKMLKDKSDEAVAKIKIIHRGRPTYQRSQSEYF